MARAGVEDTDLAGRPTGGVLTAVRRAGPGDHPRADRRPADHALLAVARAPTLPGPASRTERRVPVALSVAAHLLAVLALCLLVVSRRLPEPVPAPAIPVVFVPAPAVEAARPVETLADAEIARQAVPVVEADPLSDLPPLTLRAQQKAARQPATHRPARDAAERPTPSPTLPQARAPAPRAAQPQPDPPQAAGSTSDERSALATLEARIHQAVQDAVIYPNAARTLHREGRARLRFEYEAGTVSGIALVVSSQSGALDRAALDALRRASMPSPPVALAARRLALTIWVDFALANEG